MRREIKTLKVGEVIWESSARGNARLTVARLPAQSEKQPTYWSCLTKDDWGQSITIGYDEVYAGSKFHDEPHYLGVPFHCLPENVPAKLQGKVTFSDPSTVMTTDMLAAALGEFAPKKAEDILREKPDSMTHIYLTDDRDRTTRHELQITHAPNGDYYIAVAEEGSRTYAAVRFCTSGGCSSRNPRLLKAVCDVFEALGGWSEDKNPHVEK